MPVDLPEPDGIIQDAGGTKSLYGSARTAKR